MAGRGATAREEIAALRTIGEVAEHLDLPQHVLRFWETRFKEIDPVKRAGGRRFYRPRDIELVEAIRHLLYREGYTIKGVQRILKEQGVEAVIEDVRRRQNGESPAPASDPAAEPAQARVEPPPPETAPELAESDAQAKLDFPDPEPPRTTAPPELDLEPEPELEPELIPPQDLVLPAAPAPPAPVFHAPVAPPRREEMAQTELLRQALAEIEECKRLLNVTRR